MACSIKYLFAATAGLATCFGVETAFPVTSQELLPNCFWAFLFLIGVAISMHALCSVFGLSEKRRVWLLPVSTAIVTPFLLIAVEHFRFPLLFAKVGSYGYGLFAIPLILPFAALASWLVDATFSRFLRSIEMKPEPENRR